MQKVTQKIPAKVNLTLDIVGQKEGFHIINSLVASIDLVDAITLYKRKDKEVVLTEKGILVGCPDRKSVV